MNPSLLLIPDRYKAGKLYSQIPNTALGDLDFTRVGDTATRVNEAGLIENVLANVPRIDYTGGGCGKLLLEPQRTNILANREVMANESVTVAAVPYTLSFYGIGNVTLTGAAGLELTGTGANQRVTLTFTPTAGTLNIIVTGSCTKGQLETGIYATSYIYSLTGATVTRGADAASKTGISSLIGQTEGVIYAEVNLRNLNTGVARRLLVVSDGTANNMLQINTSTTDSRLQLSIIQDGVLQAAFTSVLSYIGKTKIAVGYASNDIAFYINGAQIGVDASAIIPACSQINVGHRFGIVQLNDRISAASLYTTRLSNAELQAITTL